MVWAFLLHQLSEGNYMAKTLPRKALISISSFNGAIYPNGHKAVIQGKTVTGFSVEGELIFRILERLKSDKVLSVIEAVSRVGADYSSPMGPFDDYSITAGRMTTGTNPASARSAAERAVKVFDGIENT